jgi:hypothetical protein
MHLRGIRRTSAADLDKDHRAEIERLTDELAQSPRKSGRYSKEPSVEIWLLVYEPV